MPGAELRARCVEPIRMRAGRRDDDVLGVAVCRLTGVAEVRRRADCLEADLMSARVERCGRRAIHPDPGEHPAGRMADVRSTGRTCLSAHYGALAVLRHHA